MARFVFVSRSSPWLCKNMYQAQRSWYPGNPYMTLKAEYFHSSQRVAACRKVWKKGLSSSGLHKPHITSALTMGKPPSSQSSSEQICVEVTEGPSPHRHSMFLNHNRTDGLHYTAGYEYTCKCNILLSALFVLNVLYQGVLILHDSLIPYNLCIVLIICICIVCFFCMHCILCGRLKHFTLIYKVYQFYFVLYHGLYFQEN